jgi:hypothetical protein
MTTGLASGVANSILDSLARNVSWTAPAAFCVKLHTGDPGSAGHIERGRQHDPSSGYLFRCVVGFDHELRRRELDERVTAETYTHVSFWSATSAGTFLGSDDLAVSRTVAVGDNFTIATGSLTLALTPIAA